MRIFHDTCDIIQFVLYLLGSRFLASVFDRNPPGDYERTLPRPPLPEIISHPPRKRHTAREFSSPLPPPSLDPKPCINK